MSTEIDLTDAGFPPQMFADRFWKSVGRMNVEMTGALKPPV